jgi:Sulfotransferase family
MMGGWWDGDRFVNQECQPHIAPQNGGLSRWCYSAPPGWREQLAKPLEEVCAWDWRQHIEAAELGLMGLPSEQKLLLRYEDLMDDLHANARLVSEFCGLAWRPAVSEFIEKKPLSRTTVSAPDPNKWRLRHGNEIERILPAVAPVMQRLGYSLSS